jgi:hypothetical protein
VQKLKLGSADARAELIVELRPAAGGKHGMH